MRISRRVKPEFRHLLDRDWNMPSPIALKKSAEEIRYNTTINIIETTLEDIKQKIKKRADLGENSIYYDLRNLSKNSIVNQDAKQLILLILVQHKFQVVPDKQLGHLNTKISWSA